MVSRVKLKFKFSKSVRSCCAKECVTVWQRSHDEFSADVTRRAGTVINDDLLTKTLGQALRSQARDNVGRKTGGETNDQVHRSCRIGLCSYDRRPDKQRNGARCAIEHTSTVKFHGDAPRT